MAVSTTPYPQSYILIIWDVPCQPVSVLCSGKGEAGQPPAVIYYSPISHLQHRRKLRLREVRQLHRERQSLNPCLLNSRAHTHTFLLNSRGTGA